MTRGSAPRHDRRLGPRHKVGGGVLELLRVVGARARVVAHAQATTPATGLPGSGPSALPARGQELPLTTGGYQARSRVRLRPRHERGRPLHELQWAYHQMRRAVAPRRLWPSCQVSDVESCLHPTAGAQKATRAAAAALAMRESLNSGAGRLAPTRGSRDGQRHAGQQQRRGLGHGVGCARREESPGPEAALAATQRVTVAQRDASQEEGHRIFKRPRAFWPSGRPTRAGPEGLEPAELAPGLLPLGCCR